MSTATFDRKKVAEKLSKSPNLQVRELSQSMSVTFGSATALKALRETLLNNNAGVAARPPAPPLETLARSMARRCFANFSS